MQNLDQKIHINYNFDRASRVLACRAHVKAFYHFLTGLALIWLLSGLVTLLNFGLIENTNALIWSAIFGFLMPALLLLALRFVIQPIAHTRVELKSRSLVVRSKNFESEVFFKDVERVDLKYIPFIAGWMKVILKDGTWYILSVALMRSEYILNALIQFNSRLVDQGQAHQYRMTAIYYDHSWARLEDCLKNRKKLFIKYGLGAFLLTVAYGIIIFSSPDAFPNIFNITLLMIGSLFCLLFLGGCLWILSEILVLSPASRRHLKLDSARPVRPIEFERRVEFLADLIYLLIVIGCFLSIIS